MTDRPTEEGTTERKEDSEHSGGGLQGKAPEIFNGDRTKSKAFISNL